MMPELTSFTTHRRGFLGRLAAGAAAFGLGGVVPPLRAAQPRSQAPAVRTPVANMQPGDFPIAGVGIDELLAKGALVGVCSIALTLNAGMIAKKLGTDGAAVKQEWVASLFPGVQIVPSGVIAANRAQEKGCADCFAGVVTR